MKMPTLDEMLQNPGKYRQEIERQRLARQALNEAIAARELLIARSRY
jgi:hypothetical protein